MICGAKPALYEAALIPLPDSSTLPSILRDEVQAVDWWLPASMVTVLVGSGVAYGITKNRVDTAHQRIDDLDRRLTALLVALEIKLDSVLRMTERIDERTKRRDE
jgi:hypothetical protein